MKKYCLLVFFVFGFLQANAQEHQLFKEDFEGSTYKVDVYAIGPGGPLGLNEWVVNNVYDGQSLYPNTTPQTNLVSGQITNAPYSYYLHVNDVLSAAENNNYKPTEATDNFVSTESFCTLNYKNVKLSFFHIAEGDADAYGEVYYSVAQGPWVKIGAAKYYNQSRWKYVFDIKDPAFDNVLDLRIGFRWVNDASNDAPSMAFGIDDIEVVGDEDTLGPPVDIIVDSLFNVPICRGQRLNFNFTFSRPVCENSYLVQLSDASGNFSPPLVSNRWHFDTVDSTGVLYVDIPSTTPGGTSYLIRVIRAGSPWPQVIAVTSVPFEIIECQVSIITQTPIILTDIDTACVNSIIDVSFVVDSGVNSNNVYIAELIDSSGPPYTIYNIGALPSSEIGSQSVAGFVPVVPPGCNYYVRVRSTSPAVNGTVVGPYCIKNCDISTNNFQDIQVCLVDLLGDSSQTIPFTVNNCYVPGNQFNVQVLDNSTLAIINTGGLGAVFDVNSGTLTLTVPGVDSLAILGIPLGLSYLRIVAANSCDPTDTTGTIVRLTIGVTSGTPLTLSSSPPFMCNSEVAYFTVDSPLSNPDSEYEWFSPNLNGGTPFIWSNPLGIDFSGSNFPPIQFEVRVREVNNNCRGPYSAAATIQIIEAPTYQIIGDVSNTCLGDTVTFTIDTFFYETYFEWSVLNGTIVDQSNTSFTVTWDSAGSDVINIITLNNECGNSQISIPINLVSVIDLDARGDTAVCAGEPVKLKPESLGLTLGAEAPLGGNQGNKPGIMFNVGAYKDITITTFAVEALSFGPTSADFEVYYKTGTYQTFETNPSAWALIETVNNVTLNPSGLTELGLSLNRQIFAGQSAAFYISSATPSVNLLQSQNSVGFDTIYDNFYLNISTGAGLDHTFSNFTTNRGFNGIMYYNTESGVSYEWRDSDGRVFNVKEITVSPTDTTSYIITASDSAGCKKTDSLTIYTHGYPVVTLAVSDSVICPGDQVQFTASGGDLFLWESEETLSSTTVANPTCKPVKTNTYMVAVTNSVTTCKTTEEILVEIDDCEFYIHAPQAFSPNGDGVNDYFTVFGLNVSEYNIKIFNRWGELVYESTDTEELNDLNRGWDGTYKGEPQKLDTYVYYVNAKGVVEGRPTAEFKGNITLVR